MAATPIEPRAAQPTSPLTCISSIPRHTAAYRCSTRVTWPLRPDGIATGCLVIDTARGDSQNALRSCGRLAGDERRLARALAESNFCSSMRMADTTSLFDWLGPSRRSCMRCEVAGCAEVEMGVSEIPVSVRDLTERPDKGTAPIAHGRPNPPAATLPLGFGSSVKVGRFSGPGLSFCRRSLLGSIETR